jgi:hypothetical protein
MLRCSPRSSTRAKGTGTARRFEMGKEKRASKRHLRLAAFVQQVQAGLFPSGAGGGGGVSCLLLPRPKRPRTSSPQPPPTPGRGRHTDARPQTPSHITPALHRRAPKLAHGSPAAAAARLAQLRGLWLAAAAAALDSKQLCNEITNPCRSGFVTSWKLGFDVDATHCFSCQTCREEGMHIAGSSQTLFLRIS